MPPDVDLVILEEVIFVFLGGRWCIAKYKSCEPHRSHSQLESLDAFVSDNMCVAGAAGYAVVPKRFYDDHNAAWPFESRGDVMPFKARFYLNFL